MQHCILTRKKWPGWIKNTPRDHAMRVLAHAVRSVSKRKRKTGNKLRWLHTTASVRPEHCELFPNMHHLRKRWGCTESVCKTSSSEWANRRAAVHVSPVPIGLNRKALLRRRISLAMLSRLDLCTRSLTVRTSTRVFHYNGVCPAAGLHHCQWLPFLCMSHPVIREQWATVNFSQ